MMLFMAGRYGRLRLCARVSLVVGIVIALKLAAHSYGWEIISLNPLFSGIIAANVFLIHDLDNPFGYYERDSAEDVSLKPLDDLMAHLEALAHAVPQAS